MISVIRALFWWLLRCLARLRYRVRVIGGEQLADLRGPTLVMPNHPGYNDPPLVLSHLRTKNALRPAVIAYIYRNPLLNPIMRVVGALEIPELTEHSRGAREQTLSVIDAIVSGVERGESFLVYPSGRVQRGTVEKIGAARAAAEIIERCPQANIVLVRTRGVWGSSFTFARTGDMPHLGRCLLRGVGWLLASLLFFAPRREVTITVEVLDRRALPGVDRERLNPFLEEWYNRGGPERPTFVPYHHWLGPRDFRFPDLGKAEHIDTSKVRPATINAVCDLIEEHLKRPLEADERRPEASLEEIGLDSLERMDIALQIEDRFGFRSDQVADTLGQLWALAEGQLARSDDGPQPVPPAWSRPQPHTPPVDVLADTVAEAFVRRALQQPSNTAVADRVSGVLSYRRMLVATQLLGKRMSRLEGQAIGVLLPASVAADLVFFSLHRFGKLPVMLNWTTGPANLAHAVATLKIRWVVTSRKLIDRLGIEIQGASYIFLEDLKADVGKLEALVALAETYLLPGRLLKRLPRPQVDEPAVVLFTSGSESTPKAVPLSHRNLLTNASDGLDVLEATHTDAMLGFLPPFHSFGLLGTMLVPILGGFRVVHHPDPTDAAGLVRAVVDYQTTFLVSTPTFLSYMFGQSKPDSLHTLRIIVTGAEKCPDPLFARAQQLAPNVTILEGYGITECSPVVSGNRPRRVKLGTVGLPLRTVSVCVVHPETKQPLPLNTTGLLLVRGPSIFSGYLNYDGPDPFLQVDGHKWYVTGDLVEIDDDHYIHFRGRLKRFLKVGGEMVSLPALEEPFNDLYPPSDKGPQVAIEGVDTGASRRIVLFTTQDIPLRQANAILAEAGFRGVMRLDEVRRIESIPVLGTGKTDYKVLRRMVTEG